jgi:hypothetical protein
MEFGSTKITPLGEYVLAHDASLSLPATQWLMHYHLSAPHGPGPRFWHDLTLKLPELVAPIRSAELVDIIGLSVTEEGREPIVEDSLQKCGTAYLGTYSKSEGLESLGILEHIQTPNGKPSNTYQTVDPQPVPPGVLAYALSHYWEGQFGSVQTRNLSDLSEPGGFGSLFFLSQFALNRSLRGLASEGVLELWLQAPPHQLLRPPPSISLLEGIYAD